MNSHSETSGEPDDVFVALYRTTYRKTLAYALRRTRTAADAHDVVADTYMIAWRRIGELSEVREPQAWLYAVAYRVLTNQRRAALRRDELIQKVGLHERTAQGSVSPSSLAEERDEVAIVARAMSTLAERDQEVLRLAAFEELNHEEIAQALGINKALVRSILYRARRRLGTALDQQERRQMHSSGHNTRGRTRQSSREGSPDE